MAGIGSAPGILVGFGVGAAASAALEPAFEIPRQEAWKRNRNRVLDPATIARLVAQGGIKLDATAYDYAHRHGYTDDKLDALVYLAQTVPGAAEALFLWRLGETDETGYREALTKLGIRKEWQDRMVKTFSVPLTAAEAAVAIHHNVIPNQGQLPGLNLDTTGKVLRFPQVDIDAYKSAEAYGYSNAQLDAITRTLGLPPGLDLVARGVFRKIFDRGDFTLAALQSNRRTEWQEFEFEVYRQILTALEYVEAQVRGQSTADERRANTAKHGMSPEDSDLLYQISGRGLSGHAITTGLAKGGTYPGSYTNVPEPYRNAFERALTREEFSELAYANRFSPPSLFVIRTLLKDGAYTQDHAALRIRQLGIFPEDADLIAAHYAPAAGAVADPHVAKAETQLWTATHKSYIAEEIDDATATAALETAGVAAGAVPAVLTLWQAERALVRKQLSPAKIVKALKASDVNAATGQPWTEPEALAALVARGYSQTEAQDLINIG